MENPLLRPLDFQPVSYQGQQMWLLRDPLKLSGTQLIVPAPIAQMLTLFDGSRTPQEIHATFCQMIGSEIDFSIIHEAINQLNDAFLLDNRRSQEKESEILAAYRAQPYRPPALAGISYPSAPGDLVSELKDYGAGDKLENWSPWTGRGIVSPHIDYQRGGVVYSRVWNRAAPAVAAADLVLIFGTDHNGGPETITLTRQPYATPFGIIPPDLTLVDKLAESIGTESAFAEELHHREEHSVELSAVWLHHIYQQTGTAPKPMVPILVGSFHHFLQNGNHPDSDLKINNFMATLKQETAGLRVLAVASVDLAHVGPNFGDNFNMDQWRRTSLRAQDDALMETAVRGDAGAWYEKIADVQDRNRICGFAPTYLLLRYLGPTTGHKIGYDQCPADIQNASLVSICGLLLD